MVSEQMTYVSMKKIFDIVISIRYFSWKWYVMFGCCKRSRAHGLVFGVKAKSQLTEMNSHFISTDV